MLGFSATSTGQGGLLAYLQLSRHVRNLTCRWKQLSELLAQAEISSMTSDYIKMLVGQI